MSWQIEWLEQLKWYTYVSVFKDSLADARHCLYQETGALILARRIPKCYFAVIFTKNNSSVFQTRSFEV
jgi:hypothetical protein